MIEIVIIKLGPTYVYFGIFMTAGFASMVRSCVSAGAKILRHAGAAEHFV